MVLFALVLAIDFFSKIWVQKAIPMIQLSEGFPYGGIPVFEKIAGISFSLVHTTNTGAAWSLFTGQTLLLLIFRLVLGGVFVYYGFKRGWPYFIIAAGAIGNALDVIRCGHVTDFFLFQFGNYIYPVFNVADSAICIGVFFLLIQRGKKYAYKHS